MCRRELVELQERLAELEARGTRVWAVSADGPADARAVARHVPGITVVADQELAMIDAFGVRHEGARPDGGDGAYPTHVLLDARGVVRWVRRPPRNSDRPSPEDVLAAIDAL